MLMPTLSYKPCRNCSGKDRINTDGAADAIVSAYSELYLGGILVTGADAADERGGVSLLAVDDEAAAPGTRVY
ncbi:MAG: hypothetical protein VXY70_03660 [Actinomycetota bacterium]|nr:hypothetical protein [Actinomycetota bacterium]